MANSGRHNISTPCPSADAIRLSICWILKEQSATFTEGMAAATLIKPFCIINIWCKKTPHFALSSRTYETTGHKKRLYQWCDETPSEIRFELQPISVIRPYDKRISARHWITGWLGFQVIIDEYPNLTGTAVYFSARGWFPAFIQRAAWWALCFYVLLNLMQIYNHLILLPNVCTHFFACPSNLHVLQQKVGVCHFFLLSLPPNAAQAKRPFSTTWVIGIF